MNRKMYEAFENQHSVTHIVYKFNKTNTKTKHDNINHPVHILY